MSRVGRALAIAAAVTLPFGVLYAQGRGGQNWSTTSADAQRSGWLRSETRISVEALQKPNAGAFQLLWKVKPANEPRQLNTLTQPLILGNLISHKGFKALAFIGGSADIVYAYDYDLGIVYWSQKLNTATPTANSSPTCPGGLTAITRNTPLNPTPPLGAAGGRGPAPQSGINPSNLPITNAVWAISSGGMVHALNPHIGSDLRAPVRIVPTGAKVVGSILVDNILYAATSDGCGSAPNGVWALDVSSEGASRNAKMWDSGGASIAGNTGPTLGLNNVVTVATGAGSGQYANAVVALDSKTLEVRGWFTGSAPFSTSPVAFNHDGRDVVAVAARDGRLYLLDGTAPGGADHKTVLARSSVYSTGAAAFSPGAVTTWQDPDGVRWLLVASAGVPGRETTFPAGNGPITNGTVVAFKLRGRAEGLAFEPGWTARDLTAPTTPIVLNDAAFVLSSGAFTTADAQVPAAQRLQRSSAAVLYALDARTGRELWSSGRTVTSSVQGLAPSGQDGQVYVVAADGTLYAFGIPLEH
jgi:hypothetical protein